MGSGEHLLLLLLYIAATLVYTVSLLFYCRKRSSSPAAPVSSSPALPVAQTATSKTTTRLLVTPGFHSSPRTEFQTPHPFVPFVPFARFAAMFGSTRKAKDGVKTEFVYADGAKDDVQLSGDWNDWKAIQMFHEGGGMWSVVTPVPPGPHEFKYIVDGEWKHSNRHPTIGIDDTSLNNVRVVLPQPDLNPPGGGPGQRDPRSSKARERESKASARESRARDRDARSSKAKKNIFGK